MDSSSGDKPKESCFCPWAFLDGVDNATTPSNETCSNMVSSNGIPSVLEVPSSDNTSKKKSYAAALKPNHCKGVGHSVVSCKFFKFDMEKSKEKEKEKGKNNVTKDKTAVVQPTPVDAGEGAINEKEGLNKNHKKRWRKNKRDEASTLGTMQGQAQDRPAENDSEVTEVVNISETMTTKIGTIPEENRPSTSEERLLAKVFGDDEGEEKEDHKFVDAVDTNVPTVEQNKANDEVSQGQCSLEVHQDIQGQYDDTDRIEDILVVKVPEKSDRIIEEAKIIVANVLLQNKKLQLGSLLSRKEIKWLRRQS
ncbi:hypothetical protein IFM89_018610 [Coptis chinensis]|uniref:Uncharacterized protein n=1 Tax=Coptis chinensis TaxID=261450 RepID=A0A835LJR8_9MAGN|nr:hypothetical protein IFM89_018610 [Coptis chinensis]